MQAALPIDYLSSSPISPRQWCIALLVAFLVHAIAFVTYRTFADLDDDGAKNSGEKGIYIGLKKLLPPPSKQQLIQPRPKLESKPVPAVVMPEIIEEPELQEIVEEAVQEEAPAVDESLLGGGNPDLEIMYASRLLSWLERFKRYPVTARRRGQEDIILLQFTIETNGQLVSYQLTSSSRYSILNEAVEKMILQASPMPEIPEELRNGKTKFTYTVPVEFKLTR